MDRMTTVEQIDAARRAYAKRLKNEPRVTAVGRLRDTIQIIADQEFERQKGLVEEPAEAHQPHLAQIERRIQTRTRNLKALLWGVPEPQVSIDFEVLMNLNHHWTKEARYHEQEGEDDKSQMYRQLAESLQRAMNTCTGDEITFNIRS